MPEGTKLGGELSPELLEKLRSVPVLASLTDAQMSCLEGATELYLEDGGVVTRQGEVSRFFWILLEGEVALSQADASGDAMMLHVMPPGSAFGELPLLASMPHAVSSRSVGRSHMLRLDEDGFWNLMTSCPEVRRGILGNMAMRLQKMQSVTMHQEKMASLGTLAAGLMHELNNPGAAARRAASQLRENLLRLHTLSAKFMQSEITASQKRCMLDLQEYALGVKTPLRLNSLEQSDAEERLTEWMEAASIEDAWKLAPTLVTVGIDAACLECARSQFAGPLFGDALSWMEALVSSMQLVATIEESIGRVGDLVGAVKRYAYEGKGQKQTLDVNDSVHATLVILGHKFREKQIAVTKEFEKDLPLLTTASSGLNQVWTNLLDNAIDAVQPKGQIQVRTWSQDGAICVSVTDNGAGIPVECQKNVFDPFFTTKGVGVGTGLGLGIVHRIVEQFGGRILFSSEPGRTEFLVRLPVGQDK